MDSDVRGGDMVPDNLKKQLALAVRSIHWSYAIYWSISATHTGTLEWSGGYYNGDVKTRKTNQAVDVDADLLGLSRSERLRELYESLSSEETNLQAKRLLTALSPEDLSDTEWYYLVSMSFIFNIGQGLPGRTKQSGQPIWLYDACNADSQNFSRSLLAKTVVCFPFMEGIVELGMTELVSDDSNLIQHVKTIMESEYQISNKKSTTGYTPEKQYIHANLNDAKGFVEQEIVSPLEEHDKVFSIPEKECLNDYCLQEDEDCNHQCDDMHYQSILSSLFKTSHQLIVGPQFRFYSVEEKRLCGMLKVRNAETAGTLEEDII